MTIAAKILSPQPAAVHRSHERRRGSFILIELMPTCLSSELTDVHVRYATSTDFYANFIKMWPVLCAIYTSGSPIIHRDISSANVLLEPLPNG